MTDRGRHLIERLAFLGVGPADSDEVRTQKVTLTLAAWVVTLLSFVWVGTYLALGLPVSAAIPFAYQVVSVASLAIFARTKDFRFFRASQLILILLLPFLLQLSLGGYVASSAVILWALVGALGALFFYSVREAIPWFVAFIVLVIVAGFLEPIASEHPAPIPVAVQTAFFVLNILGVALTAYLLLQYSVRARDAALASSERLLLNVLPAPIAARLKRHEGRIAEAHADVTVLFADVVDFTPLAEHLPPERVVGVLDEVFSAFDELAQRHGLEKIKTIGDAYMVVAGLPEPRADHAEAMAEMALEMQEAIARLRGPSGSTSPSGSGWRAARSSPASSGATSSSTTCGAIPSTPPAGWRSHGLAGRDPGHRRHLRAPSRPVSLRGAWRDRDQGQGTITRLPAGGAATHRGGTGNGRPLGRAVRARLGVATALVTSALAGLARPSTAS